jgi:hypothetical protein
MAFYLSRRQQIILLLIAIIIIIGNVTLRLRTSPKVVINKIFLDNFWP